MRRLLLCASIAVVLFAPAPALAQRTTATVRGTIRDPRRPSCPASPSPPPTRTPGSCRSTMTNDSGVYRSPTCPSAATGSRQSWRVSRGESRTNVVLRVADEYSIDFKLAAGDITEVVTVVASATPVQLLGGDVSGVDHGRAGARAAAQRPQLPAARDADAGRQRAGLPQRQGQGAARRLGPLGQRRRRHRQHVDGRRRQQQRRRLEPHDPGLSLARSHRGVQDPAQQLRPGIRRRRRRADQHRDPRRHQPVPRSGRSTRAATTRSTPRTISSRRPTSPRKS